MTVARRSEMSRRVRLGAASIAFLVASGIALPLASAATSLGLNDPVALATANGDVFVANKGANSVTELTATGALVRVIDAKADGLSQPQALSVNGGDLFVANASGSITELRVSTGALVRVIAAKSYRFSDPVALLSVHSQLWVANKGSSTLTVLSAIDGSLLRVVANKATAHAFDNPVALAVTPSRSAVWVANPANATVTEISTRTFGIMRVISATAGALSSPDGITINRDNAYVANSGTNSVSVISTTTGALLQNITNSSLNANYGFNEPATMLSLGSTVYVVSPPGDSPMVTQLQASSGNSNWMMCNTNFAFHFLAPSALVVDGTTLWVANAGNNTLTMMDAASGTLVKDLPVSG